MELREALARYKRGQMGEDEMLAALARLQTQDLGFARLDHGRELRKGFPEVVYGAGKTPEQILEIAGRILERSGRLLVTRTHAEVHRLVRKRHPQVRFHPLAHCVYYEGDARVRAARRLPQGSVLVVAAGTSDLPVAEEAVLTARLMGCEVDTLYDVGVAGVHRLLGQLDRLHRASVIVVVAGMEAALGSVVGGLARCPVIGVPTSVGYGASFGGLAALLGMLNACASGLTVVNIDNGFGAGFAAAQVIRLLNRAPAPEPAPAATPARPARARKPAARRRA